METTILSSDMVDARVAPKGSFEHLSQEEIAKLLDSGQGGLYPLFRKCALAVLNSGSEISRFAGDLREVSGFRPAHHAPGLGDQARNQKCAGVGLRRWGDDQGLEGSSVRRAARRGVHLERNHGKRPLRSHFLCRASPTRCFTSCATPGCSRRRCGRISRCAGAAIPSAGSNTTTPRKSATSSGLRGLDVCTGCGPGAMKGPMKGATIGHSKQRIVNGRYLGITEPGIIAAEPPEPDRQPAGHHAGHREALGGLRAVGTRHRHFSGRRGHRGGDSVPARHPARSRPIATCRFRWYSRDRRTCRGLLPADPRFHRRNARDRRPIALPDHHRRSRRGGPRHGARASPRCATTAAARAIPTDSTGC